MIVVAIFSILATIGSAGWNQYREKNKVDIAKGMVVSLLQRARLKALSSGVSQSVLFTWADNTVTAFGTTTAFDSGVDLVGYKCTAPVAAYADAGASTFSFNRSGTVTYTSTVDVSGNPQNIKISSGNSGRVFYIKVRNVTGRIAVGETC